MGLLGKAMKLVVGGGPEAEGLALLNEAIAQLSIAETYPPEGVDPRRILFFHEGRALRAVLKCLKTRGFVSPEAERQALEAIEAHECLASPARVPYQGPPPPRSAP
jgi:hypothetical protein